MTREPSIASRPGIREYGGAKTPTRGDVTGFVTAEEYQPLGAFMNRSGGWRTDAAQTSTTAGSKANDDTLGPRSN
ncbi:hypothetical protein [Streptomyces sp. NPDC055105]|uniref:hypothetical protein n=1 Tax=Streptomyces sp. NPDC055105 TaxID=3365719 RepID=UPI0037D408EF